MVSAKSVKRVKLVQIAIFLFDLTLWLLQFKVDKRHDLLKLGLCQRRRWAKTSLANKLLDEYAATKTLISHLLS